jgi:hypothetical protein
MNDILELKWRLPLPDLLKQIGLGAHAKRSAPCPLHEDKNPSFSMFQTVHGWRFKCHAGCGEGDEIIFLEKWRGLSRGEAIRFYANLVFAPGSWGFDTRPPIPRDTVYGRPCEVPPPGAKGGVKIILPADVHEGDENELRTLASLRSVSFWAVAAMKQLGTLRFGTVCGEPSWIVLDASLRSAEARRLDGKLYAQTAHLGERKVHTLRGSAKNWPVGLLPERELGAHFKRILLLEGSGDLVAGYHFALGTKGEWLPATLLGATVSRLHPGRWNCCAAGPSGSSLIVILRGQRLPSGGRRSSFARVAMAMSSHCKVSAKRMDLLSKISTTQRNCIRGTPTNSHSFFHEHSPTNKHDRACNGSSSHRSNHSV